MSEGKTVWTDYFSWSYDSITHVRGARFVWLLSGDLFWVCHISKHVFRTKVWIMGCAWHPPRSDARSSHCTSRAYSSQVSRVTFIWVIEGLAHAVTSASNESVCVVHDQLRDVTHLGWRDWWPAFSSVVNANSLPELSLGPRPVRSLLSSGQPHHFTSLLPRLLFVSVPAQCFASVLWSLCTNSHSSQWSCVEMLIVTSASGP